MTASPPFGFPPTGPGSVPNSLHRLRISLIPS